MSCSTSYTHESEITFGGGVITYRDEVREVRHLVAVAHKRRPYLAHLPTRTHARTGHRGGAGKDQRGDGTRLVFCTLRPLYMAA